MKSAADQCAGPRCTCAEMYPPVQQELCSRSRNCSASELSSEHPFVDRLVKYGVRLGGKRLRPALVLLSARACGRCSASTWSLAAAVEMIHTATLVHDDVLDEATLRRHLDTVNSRWNNETSVLLGDYLFTRALCLASSVDELVRLPGHRPGQPRHVRGRAAPGRQPRQLRPERAGVSEHHRRQDGRPDRLLLPLGHITPAPTPDVEAALTQYGLELGIAFQIADDLLDMLGDEATVGKSLGTDLMKQKSTLPLIRVLQQASQAERAEVVGLLSRSDNHRRDALRPWLDRFDAVAYAQEKARVTAAWPRTDWPPFRRARPATPCPSWPASWSCARTLRLELSFLEFVLRIGESINVAFRSAKVAAFAERKATKSEVLFP